MEPAKQLSVVIPSPESGGGSGAGWSRYSNYLLAPGLRTPMGDAAKVGIVTHALLEHYYRGDLDSGDVILDYEAGTNDPVFREALRLFAEYRQRYPRDEFTRVHGCEIPIEAKKPETVGILPFTGRLDMVVYVDEECAERMISSRGLMLRPGYYNFDTKTKSRRDSNLAEVYNSSPQFALYHAVWAENYPEIPLQGTIVNVIIRHKILTDNSFMSTLVAPPSEADIDMAKDLLAFCKMREAKEALIGSNYKVGLKTF